MYSSIQKKSPLVQKWPSFVLFSLLLEKNRERLYDCSRCVVYSVLYFHQKFYHKVRSIVMSKHTELDCRPLHLLFHNELKYSQKNPFWQKINIFEIIFESKLKTQSLSTIIPETKFNILSNSALSCLGKWTFSPYLSS